VDSLREEHKQMQRKVASALGRDPRNPMDRAGQLRREQLLSDLQALPLDPNSFTTSQVFDPSSPNFGQRRFIAGVSSLSGTDVFE
jgi:hypothetical protein